MDAEKQSNPLENGMFQRLPICQAWVKNKLPWVAAGGNGGSTEQSIIADQK